MSEIALYIVLFAFASFLGLEKLKPAHKSPKIRGWYFRAIVINAISILTFILFDLVIGKYQIDASLFDLGKLHPVIGAFIAYVVFTFVVYWWHRLRHQSDFFWQHFHQIHHSPARIETLTAYYIHPLDMFANLFISNTIVFLLLGLGIEAAAWYTVITGIAGILIHANIRIPRWIGLIFQTPEMHRLHHKSGHHTQNFSDIVIWDMLFGTYENPVEDVQQCGFTENTESKVISMLIGNDVLAINR